MPRSVKLRPGFGLAFILMGLLTLTPAIALFAPAQLASYGVTDPDPISLALLQHRGVLQGALGAALIYAAFVRAVRSPVAVAAIITKAAFLALILTTPEARAASSLTPLIFDPICILILGAWLLRDQFRPGLRGGLSEQP